MGTNPKVAEATAIIQDLVDGGWTMEKIAESTGVSKRTVYRWLREGTEPHPILLDGLRRAKTGGRDGNQEGAE